MRFDPNSDVGRAIAQAVKDGRAVEGPGVNLAALDPPDPDADEKEFMAAVVKVARRAGWTCFHQHDSRKSPEGQPDLLFWRPPVHFVAELKVEPHKPTPAQLEKLALYIACGIPAKLWYPRNWPEIVRTLEGKDGPT